MLLKPEHQLDVTHANVRRELAVQIFTEVYMSGITILCNVFLMFA